MKEYLIAFLAGLTTGGLSCFIVQGSLLATSLKSNKFLGVSSFLVSKLIAYSLLGGFLGLIGSSFVLAPKSYALIQLFIGLFLIGNALRIMNVHPIFRYFVIPTPKFLFRIAHKSSKLDSVFAPALAGFFTILLPCGVTQGYLLQSVVSKSFVNGSLLMFFFVSGTIPLFFIMGTLSAEFLKHKAFNIFSGTVLLLLGLYSINSASVLFGSNHTFQNYWKVLTENNIENKSTTKEGKQEVVITVTNSGYSANVNSIKAGVPTKLIVKTNNTYSCARAFTIPSLGITKILPTTGQEIIEFTPKKAGRLNFSCTMGMYTGSINVVE